MNKGWGLRSEGWQARSIIGANIEILSRLADHADEADHADLKFLMEFGWRTEEILGTQKWRKYAEMLLRSGKISDIFLKVQNKFQLR